jgi:hypothetical protein
MKKSQVERVKCRIEQMGYITRNECLHNYITRLSAIIYILEKKYGMIFKTEERGGDYIYKLIK